jgi:hypothetical protein
MGEESNDVEEEAGASEEVEIDDVVVEDEKEEEGKLRTRAEEGIKVLEDVELD